MSFVLKLAISLVCILFIGFALLGLIRTETIDAQAQRDLAQAQVIREKAGLQEAYGQRAIMDAQARMDNVISLLSLVAGIAILGLVVCVIPFAMPLTAVIIARAWQGQPAKAPKEKWPEW